MMIRRCTVLSLLAITCVWLSACDSGNVSVDTQQVEPAPVEAKEIQWFEGSVDEAFRVAEETGTPVYLYWGAVWCPPCQEIKHTVFKSTDFIALSNLFIPVYLDGDTKQAQAVGERFGVQGYPTMIVFSPRGEEITRIPGGLDISRYNSVLELSLNQMQPTTEL
ncbi:MAG: thioredoxin family protein, partial [Pseudomonadales bacterium]|nr:thioredoxin family protein [Pseudomonadales bacterium]